MISFQIKPWVAFGLPYLLIELFYIGMPVVRTDGHVITKFSRMGRLPHFLCCGAPPTRGASSSASRHCPFCGCNVIEDEVHFLFQCPTYSMIRNKFYYKVKTPIPNITQLPIKGLINELMNSSNYFINIQFIKYITACFDVRDKLLSK